MAVQVVVCTPTSHHSHGSGLHLDLELGLWLVSFGIGVIVRFRVINIATLWCSLGLIFQIEHTNLLRFPTRLLDVST